MFLHIALKDLKIVFKDKKALAVMLVMPALIMLILGSALGGMFTNELRLNKFSVGVVNNDSGKISQVFVEDVLKKEMTEIFDTKEVSEEEALKRLEDKTYPVIIIIPENFSQNIENRVPVKIVIRSQMNDQFKTSIVESVTNSFTQNLSLSYAAVFSASDAFIKYYNSLPPGFDVKNEISKVISEIQKKLGSAMVGFKEQNTEKAKNVTGMQYYSAAMLVMFVLFGIVQGTKLMVEEREMKTLGRIMSTRVSSASLIFGKFLGLMCICLMQSLILITFTHLVYGVDWGESIIGVALVTICSVFSGAGLGMLVASIARTPKVADGLGNLIIQVFTILGGGMIPVYVMPDAVKVMSKGTLNWWAMQGYNELMMGAGVGTILPNCGILILMGLVYLVIGTLRFRVE